MNINELHAREAGAYLVTNEYMARAIESLMQDIDAETVPFLLRLRIDGAMQAALHFRKVHEDLRGSIHDD